MKYTLWQTIKLTVREIIAEIDAYICLMFNR